MGKEWVNWWWDAKGGGLTDRKKGRSERESYRGRGAALWSAWQRLLLLAKAAALAASACDWVFVAPHGMWSRSFVTNWFPMREMVFKGQRFLIVLIRRIKTSLRIFFYNLHYNNCAMPCRKCFHFWLSVLFFNSLPVWQSFTIGLTFFFFFLTEIFTHHIAAVRAGARDWWLMSSAYSSSFVFLICVCFSMLIYF